MHALTQIKHASILISYLSVAACCLLRAFLLFITISITMSIELQTMTSSNILVLYTSRHYCYIVSGVDGCCIPADPVGSSRGVIV